MERLKEWAARLVADEPGSAVLADMRAYYARHGKNGLNSCTLISRMSDVRRLVLDSFDIDASFDHLRF